MIKACPIPEGALLNTYLKTGTYIDCYVTSVAESESFARYVAAFYTTRVFKMERFILKFAISKPSTDEQATQLGDGSIDSFAAWKVEARNENQLLLCDIQGRTRSWLMVVPEQNSAGTRLYFGSAVVPIKHPRTGKFTLGVGFKALLGFHRLYSKVLLAAAKSQLRKASQVSN